MLVLDVAIVNSMGFLIAIATLSSSARRCLNDGNMKILQIQNFELKVFIMSTSVIINWRKFELVQEFKLTTGTDGYTVKKAIKKGGVSNQKVR